MNGLRNRPRLMIALALAVVLVMGVVGGVVATTFGRTGGPLKAIKTRVSDSTITTPDGQWRTMPDMSLSMTVPAGEEALFLVTFSAESACFSAFDDPNECFIRAQANGTTIEPSEIVFSSNLAGMAANSMQFVAGPLPAGDYTIRIQWRSAWPDGYFWVSGRTLTVVRSKV